MSLSGQGLFWVRLLHGFLEALGANCGVLRHFNRDVFLALPYPFTWDSTPI